MPFAALRRTGIIARLPAVRGIVLLAIVNFFIDLALLRRVPQDLPASPVLFALVLAVGLFGGVLLAITAGARITVGLAQTVLDFALMLGALYLALNLVKHPRRFLQAGTALVGTETLIGLLALLPVSFAIPGSEDTGLLALAGLMFLGLVGWSVLISGHILRHTFGITLVQGVAIAIAFDLLSFVVVGALTETSL
jgi:hypothetical protein